MPYSEIKTYPNPVLRKKSEKVNRVTGEERKLIDYMTQTMYANEGIGLAAPQVGVAKRIIIVASGSGLLKMANPEITAKKGSSFLEEGCLSVPGSFVEIQRAEEISVSFLDENGNALIKNFSGLAARAIQHEIDHLNGKLIIDYLPWYKKVFPKRGEVKCLQ